MYYRKEIPAVYQVDGVKPMLVLGEEIRKGNAVWLKSEATVITKTVKAHDVYMIAVHEHTCC